MIFLNSTSIINIHRADLGQIEVVSFRMLVSSHNSAFNDHAPDLPQLPNALSIFDSIFSPVEPEEALTEHVTAPRNHFWWSTNPSHDGRRRSLARVSSCRDGSGAMERANWQALSGTCAILGKSRMRRYWSRVVGGCRCRLDAGRWSAL